jgi:hypothetical protein
MAQTFRDLQFENETRLASSKAKRLNFVNNQYKKKSRDIANAAETAERSINVLLNSDRLKQLESTKRSQALSLLSQIGQDITYYKKPVTFELKYDAPKIIFKTSEKTAFARQFDLGEVLNSARYRSQTKPIDKKSIQKEGSASLANLAALDATLQQRQKETAKIVESISKAKAAATAAKSATTATNTGATNGNYMKIVKEGTKLIGKYAVNIAIASAITPFVGPIGAALMVPFISKGVTLTADIMYRAAAGAVGHPVVDEEPVVVEKPEPKTVVENVLNSAGTAAANTVAYGIASCIVSSVLTGTLDTGSIASIGASVMQGEVGQVFSKIFNSNAVNVTMQTKLMQYIAGKFGTNTLGTRFGRLLSRWCGEGKILSDRKKRTLTHILRSNPSYLDTTWKELVENVAKDVVDTGVSMGINAAAANAASTASKVYTSAADGGLQAISNALADSYTNSAAVFATLMQSGMNVADAIKNATVVGYEAIYGTGVASQVSEGLTVQPTAEQEASFINNIQTATKTASNGGSASAAAPPPLTVDIDIVNTQTGETSNLNYAVPLTGVGIGIGASAATATTAATAAIPVIIPETVLDPQLGWFDTAMIYGLSSYVQYRRFPI